MFGARPSVPFAKMCAALLAMLSVSMCIRPSPNRIAVVAELTLTGSTRDWSRSMLSDPARFAIESP